MKTMTCEEFDEVLWVEGFYSEMHSEMHFERSFSSEKIWKAFLNEAEKRQISLSDKDEWDYDSVFYNNYKSDDDKSLS